MAEFRERIKTLPGSSRIHVTRDDFEMITENGRYLNSNGKCDRGQFQKMMRGELRRYSRRELSNMIALSESSEFRTTMTCLKLMEMRLNDKMDTALRNQDQMQATADTLTAITSHVDSEFTSWTKVAPKASASGQRAKHGDAIDGGAAALTAGTNDGEAETSGGGGGNDAKHVRAFAAVLESIDSKLERLAGSLLPGSGDGGLQAISRVDKVGILLDEDETRVSAGSERDVETGVIAARYKDVRHRWQSKARRMSVDPLFDMTIMNVPSLAMPDAQGGDLHEAKKVKHAPEQASEQDAVQLLFNGTAVGPLALDVRVDDEEESVQGEAASLVSQVALGDGIDLNASPLMARRREKQRAKKMRHVGEFGGQTNGQAAGSSSANEEAGENQPGGAGAGAAGEEHQLRELLVPLPRPAVGEAGEEHLEAMARQLLHSPREFNMEIEASPEATGRQGGGRAGGAPETQGRMHNKGGRAKFKAAVLAVGAAGRLKKLTQGTSGPPGHGVMCQALYSRGGCSHEPITTVSNACRTLMC